MIQDNSKPQEQEAATSVSDPAINKDAVNEAVDKYEESSRLDEEKELDSLTQKELGEVERALEDTMLGIEDAS